MVEPFPKDAVIIGDLFRANTDFSFNQAANVYWLYCVLRSALSPLFRSVKSYDQKFGDMEYGELLSEVYNDKHGSFFEKIAMVFSHGPNNAKIDEVIINQLKDKFVIAFEATPWMQKFFQENSIFYCNICVHPARFAADLILSFEFSCPDTMRRAKQFSLDPDFLCADVSYARTFYRARGQHQAEDSIFFLSQTSYDSILIERGHFIDVRAYRERILQIAQGRNLCMKPHPQEPKSRIFQEFMEIFPEARIETINIYELLASRENCHFITFSSGSGHEAELFGHSVHYLSTRNHGLHSRFQSDYAHVSHAFWAPTFWRYVLHGEGEPQSRHPFVPDRTRKSLGIKWGKDF